VLGLRYVVLVGEWFLVAIFLFAVVGGIRSWLWKIVWPVAAGSVWYFAGPFYAFPLMIAVIVRVAMMIVSSAQGPPAKEPGSHGGEQTT